VPEWQLNPSAFPAHTQVAGKTRDEVLAELAEAIRTGDIIGNAATGLTLREEFPQRYAGKARAGGTQTAAVPGTAQAR
jgi:hypothetical protein